MAKRKSGYNWEDFAKVLMVIGGLNWLGFAFGYNAINRVLGAWPMAELVVYVLVGLSALWFAKMWYMD